jgi:hypothetical protein
MKGLAKTDWLPLEPGDFYYNEQGLLVFTAQYLLKRGFCCKNGCRHCPFGFKKQARQEG